MTCVIDCTHDEKYLSLLIWGKPVFFYPVQAVLSSELFDEIIIVTKSEYVEYLSYEFFENIVFVKNVFPDSGLLIDGRAANISPQTIKQAVNYIDNIKLTDVFKYCSSPEESVVVDSSNNFELSLSLCRKRHKPIWLKEMVLKRIKEKFNLFTTPYFENEICLLGHSQFDQWNIETLCGYDVRNCGISGITIREYIDYIIDNRNFKLSNRIIIVLLGINDIALMVSVEEIAKDIFELFDKVQKNTNAKIYYIQTMHTNGRIDRDNKIVDMLNNIILNNLPDNITPITMNKMDDPFGNLNCRYTTDGLHLNENGYFIFKEIIENVLSYKGDIL